MIDRRVKREPLSHLLGQRQFWSINFEVDSTVLDPRPDSEVLVETALSLWPKSSEYFSVLDLGTGSGCLLISILKERPSATGIGVDISCAALEIAKRNATRLIPDGRANFVNADWGSCFSKHFDLVIANPPYIPSQTIDDLDAEVKNFEPLLALDGGRDGLDAYRLIAKQLVRLTNVTGKILLEIGSNQSEEVKQILEKSKVRVESVKKDLAGRNRCLVATPNISQGVK